MVKYLYNLLNAARVLGAVKTIEMKEANEYLPARIEIIGKTATGDKYELKLKVGEPKRDS